MRRALAIALVLAAAPAAAEEPAGDDPARFVDCLQPLGKHDRKLLAPLARDSRCGALVGVTGVSSAMSSASSAPTGRSSPLDWRWVETGKKRR